MMRAGPWMPRPGATSERRKTGASCQFPPVNSFALARSGRRSRLFRDLRLLDRLSAALGFDLDRLDLDVLLRADKAEALPMRHFEQSVHVAQARHGDGKRAIGAGIAHMRLRGDGDSSAFDALPQ